MIQFQILINKESYLESQTQILDSLQISWSPYIQCLWKSGILELSLVVDLSTENNAKAYGRTIGNSFAKRHLLG
jgi:hypothetical protein